MNIAIDAYNIKEGGGVTHLCNLIQQSDQKYFSTVYVFCNLKIRNNLKKIARDNVVIIHNPWLDCFFLKKFFWDIFILPRELRRLKITVFFCLGGLLPFRRIKNVKQVTMCQNILPFYYREFRRAGWFLTIRRFLLQKMLIRSFCASDGLIFLSFASRDLVQKFLHRVPMNEVIYHGIALNAFQKKKDPYRLDEKNIALLYVSTIKGYKNHSSVITALSILRQRGYENIHVQFVGAQRKAVMQQLFKQIETLQLKDQVYFISEVSYTEITQLYSKASLFVFASSCESFGFPLLEAMATGLPIACSNIEPFPEIVKNAAIYFDPKVPASIADAIEALIEDKNFRSQLIDKALALSENFSWKESAYKTFAFLKKVADDAS
ncbi:MAG: hypothetical protein A2103_01200 [Gammaproteobacteria bacterium GWF2_41_13]|nr:MAG: hypothetical protein A2103_01200 [Gammaproteobacteria bacterium GWF2_41_13]